LKEISFQVKLWIFIYLNICKSKPRALQRLLTKFLNDFFNLIFFFLNIISVDRLRNVIITSLEYVDLLGWPIFPLFGHNLRALIQNIIWLSFYINPISGLFFNLTIKNKSNITIAAQYIFLPSVRDTNYFTCYFITFIYSTTNSLDMIAKLN
jgi:hypothetical protein